MERNFAGEASGIAKLWFRPVCVPNSFANLPAISPTRHARERTWLRAQYRELRRAIRDARELLKSPRYLDRENAVGDLELICHVHHTLRARRRWLASTRVEAFLHAPLTNAVKAMRVQP